MGNKILIIVDPQLDFITGVLAVPGAEQAMNSLARFVADRGAEYSHIIVTADRHPFDHCSFIEYGGSWHRHCVHDTVGAAVWQPLMDSFYNITVPVLFLYKGESAETEEYSIFKNSHASSMIADIVNVEDVDKIDLCGLAGDICVADTLCDGIRLFGKSMLGVLKAYSPSLDGGDRLNELIKKYEISCDR